jgi:hypothetical protein
MRRKAMGLALLLAGCTPESGPANAVNAARVEALFDDALEPPTVGVTLGSYEARDDETFLERAHLSEAIFRAQVTGILPMASGGWLVELTTRDVLRGETVAPKTLEVEAPPDSRTANLVGNFRPNFVRAHLLVFGRRYARTNERVQWHVHTVADTAEAREFVARSTP